MSTQDDEPTHTIPMPLQRKLKEAKDWYERRGLISQNHGGALYDAACIEADQLLQEIVEMCDDAWGFTP